MGLHTLPTLCCCILAKSQQEGRLYCTKSHFLRDVLKVPLIILLHEQFLKGFIPLVHPPLETLFLYL